jgi:hypothetical protein
MWFDYRPELGDNEEVQPSLDAGLSVVKWACGAVGSALPWHGRGRRFEPDQVHQILPTLPYSKLRVAELRWFDYASVMNFTCQDCGSHQGVRSRKRGVWETYFLPLFLLQPVRCSHCFRRGYCLTFVPLSEPVGVAPDAPSASTTNDHRAA